MYSYNELNAVDLSPTKKDYYQIWNELLDTAAKLSARWDPSTTNESDPGVVLLKVLTAVADKINYNIDANTLEAFMPSAAQESSMRKLCEMLGYTMRFYRSATTRVRITYKGDIFPEDGIIRINRFTNIRNITDTTNYITLDDILLSSAERSGEARVIEGTLVTCETSMGNRVVFENLDDNYRFYLPEQQVASNQFFVYNIDNLAQEWKQTDNLNTWSLGEPVFKFGYDSARGLPYLQFPEDISSLMGSGLSISFIRTSGIKGNVSANTLKTFEAPTAWSQVTEKASNEVTIEEVVEGESTVNTEWTDTSLYTVTNISAAKDGKDPETIDEAYWNFQKTIGTFDTLVTCRDYMNKIYQLTESDISGLPLVSNIVVSDIRDDVNKSYALTTLNDYGVTTEYKRTSNNEPIEYFDLMLYPFTAVYDIASRDDYKLSFKYTDANVADIITALEDQKTIAHRIKSPDSSEIACIKAYFQLSARLSTTERVTQLEALDIAAAARVALYKEFNMRNLTFGEELPYDLILKTILNSHTKIKNISLDDPKIYLAVCTVSGEEYPITGDYIFDNVEAAEKALDYYLNLTMKNALANKLPLLEYDNTFSTLLNLSEYPTLSGDASVSASICNETALETNTEYKLEDFEEQSACYATTATGACTVSVKAIDATDATEGLSSITLSLYEPGAETCFCFIKYTAEYSEDKSTIVSFALDDMYKTNADLVNIFGVAEKFEVSIPANSATAGLCTINFNKLTEYIGRTVTVDKMSLQADFTDSMTSQLAFNLAFSEDTSAQAELVSYQPFFSEGGSYSLVNESSSESSTIRLEQAETETTVSEITKISSEFRIDTSQVSYEKPLTLKQNEVIQFRAPSFKTVATYPAYVNYYFKANKSLSNHPIYKNKNAEAIPATMQSLTEFFNGGPEGYLEGKAWNKEISWAEKLNAFLSTDSEPVEIVPGDAIGEPESASPPNYKEPVEPTPPTSNFIKKCFKTESDIAAESTKESNARNNLQKYLAECKTLFTYGFSLGYYYTEATGSESTKYVRAYKKLDAAEDRKYHIFTVPESTDNIKYIIPENTTFYGVKFDAETLVAAVPWLQGTRSSDMSFLRADVSDLLDDVAVEDNSSNIPGVTSNPLDTIKPPCLGDVPGVNPEKIIKGLYYRSRANLNKKPGLLIDENLYEYKLITGISDLSLDDIYIPRLWSEQTEEHTIDGLGADQSYAGIPANTEYKLQTGEYLLFNYSTSAGSEDGTTLVKNIVYPAGTIIKPNFTLMCGTDLMNVAPYTKTSEFGPWSWLEGDNRRIVSGIKSGGTLEGMFTLGANEQIEIRDRVSVEIKDTTANFYWELNDKSKTFPRGSYTLKPGEYLFYTDSAREAMAYYGSGTEIILGNTTPSLELADSSFELSAEQINKLGLIASFPWVTVNLSGNSAAITINEYQYINLIEEDELTSIVLADDQDSDILNSDILNADWRKVSNASYVASEAEGSLPTFLIDDMGWEACGRLDLAIGPNTPQTLNVHKTAAGKEVARDIIKLWGKTDTGEEQVLQVYTPLSTPSTKQEGGKEALPLTLFTSDSITSNVGTVFLTTSSTGSDSNSDTTASSLKNFTVRVGVLKTPTLPNGTAFAPLNNALTPVVNSQETSASSNSDTLISGNNGKELQAILPLNLLIPNEDFGLLTINVTKRDQGAQLLVPKGIPLMIFHNTLPNKDGSINFMNNNGAFLYNWSWWADNYDDSQNIIYMKQLNFNNTLDLYTLKKGINNIVIPNSCELIVAAENTKTLDIQLSELKLVKTAKLFNSKLAYSNIGALFAINSEDTKAVLQAKNDLNNLLARKLSGEAIDEQVLIDAINAAQQSGNTLVTEVTKTISGIHYPCLHISNELALSELNILDPECKCFITDANARGIELNELDPSDTMLLAKNWFDKQNIANKFIISEIATKYLEDYVVVSKTSIR